MPTSRFNLTTLAGNQIVDWAVLEANNGLLGNNAAHLTLGNTFAGNQVINGNLGMTGVRRRITVPVPATNQSDRIHLQAEATSPFGTFVGVTAPAGASGAQRRASLVINGVEAAGTGTPAALVFELDENTKRASIQAANLYQDSTSPSLQIGVGGTDRIVIPPSGGTIAVTGAMTLTGALAATSATFSGTLDTTGTAIFRSTSTFTGQASFNGGISSATTMTINAPLNVTGLATFSGGITTGAGALTVGNTQINGTLGVTGATTLSSTLNTVGAATFRGALNLQSGASSGGAYIQAYATDLTYVQISKLTVTPGTTALAGVTVNGVSQMNGAVNVAGTVAPTTGVLTPNGSAAGYRAYDADGVTARQMLWRDPGNTTVIQTGAADIARFVNNNNTVQFAQFGTGGLTINSGGLSISSGSVSLPAGQVNFPAGASITSARYTMAGGASVLSNTGDRVRLLNHLDVDYDMVVGRTLTVNAGHLYANQNHLFFAGGAVWMRWGAAPGRIDFSHGLQTGDIRNNGALYQYGGIIYFEASNQVYIHWRSDLNALFVPYGNGLYLYSILMPTAAQPGKPPFVVGQNGDGVMRWWPASAIGPPAGSTPWNFYASMGSGGGATLEGISNSIPGFGITRAGNGGPYQFSFGKSGYYVIFAQMQLGPGGDSFLRIETNRGTWDSNQLHVEGGSWNDSGTGALGFGVFHPGDWMNIHTHQGPYTWTGQNNIRVFYCPTGDYAN